MQQTGFPLSCNQKTSGTFKDTKNVFPGLCVAQHCLNIMTMAVTYSIYEYRECDSTIHQAMVITI